LTTNLNKIRKASVYRSGTFWHEQVSPDQRELVRVLFHAIDQGNAELGLQTIPAKLTPSAWVDVWHTEIRFDTSKSLSLVLNPGTRAPIHDREFEPLPVPRVFEHDHVAGLVLDAPDDMEYWEEPQGVILVPYELETTRWAEFGYTPYSYLVRHTGVQPTTILSPSGLLFSGLDFKNTELV
jgi:hypothetical protein